CGSRAEPVAADLRSARVQCWRLRDALSGSPAVVLQLAADADPGAAGDVDLGGAARSQAARVQGEGVSLLARGFCAPARGCDRARDRGELLLERGLRVRDRAARRAADTAGVHAGTTTPRDRPGGRTRGRLGVRVLGDRRSAL